MTDPMELSEPIQEPAPGKIERLAPSGSDLRQTFEAGFDAVEECSADLRRHGPLFATADLWKIHKPSHRNLPATTDCTLKKGN